MKKQHMRVMSANLNGIRSATQKGFLDYVKTSGADIVCVQELKAQEADLTDEMRAIGHLQGYFHAAQKRGYSGVAIYSARKPDELQVGLGLPEFDSEGRFIRAKFGKVQVVSAYFPSGSSSEERQAFKYLFLDAIFPTLAALTVSGDEVILCGDWNIAHQSIDLKNDKANQKNSGFLPEERAWLSQVLAAGWVDVWRTLYPEEPGYTWWSNRARAYANNVGWRIDYQIATPNIAAAAREAWVYKEQKFSDHAPLLVDYVVDCDA